ncbi:MAG: DinB family protein [Planctomycetota bacterium]|nr:DinB family protein [Planctomycetota bacterium]
MPSLYLDDLLRQSKRLTEQTQALTQGLTEEQLNWRPDGGGWSMAQALEHLTTTAQLYAPGIDRLIVRASRKRPYKGEPFEPTWLGGGFAKYVGPEGEAKMKAPKKFRPVATPDAQTPARFLAEQENLDQRMRASLDFNLRRWKLRSPAFPLMRFTLGDAFALLVAHGQRHINQAQAIHDLPEFPGA